MEHAVKEIIEQKTIKTYKNKYSELAQKVKKSNEQ